MPFRDRPTEGDMLERTQELFSFLQGEDAPEGWTDASLKLSAQKAWSVIYYLQEWFGIIPDHFERCDNCGDLFDTEYEGAYIDEESYRGYGMKKRDIGKHFCDGCCPAYSYERCDDGQ